MKDNETMTLHKEGTLLMIALWAKIFAWVFLVIYLISLLSQILQISGGAQLPAVGMDMLMFVANMIYTPATGVFYFLILQGLAQGLYIGLYLYASAEDDD